MKSIIRLMVPAVSLVLIGAIAATQQSAVPATMRRAHDPVQVPGELLGAFHGKPLDSLRLYSSRNGTMSQMIYQFDERLENGIFIFELGVASNADKANRALDPQDFLVFRVTDTGDRVSHEEWPVKEGIEIELEDPLDGGRSYCYLLHFGAGAPARREESTTSLKHWDPWKKSELPFVVQGFSYIIEGFVNKIGNRYYKTAINRSFIVPKEAGGMGVNFIDGLKMRAFCELFFGKTKIEIDETRLIGGIDAITQGFIRGYGLQWITVALPMGLEGPRLYNDIFTYDRMVVSPLKLHIPVNPKHVITRAGIEFGYDLNEAGYGMRFYSSNCKDGAEIDGKMSEREKAIPTEWLPWYILTGPQGSLIFRVHLNMELLKQVDAKLTYIDDRNVAFPPEDVPGSIGYARSSVEITSVIPGTYEGRIEWYFPPHFYKPGGYDKNMLQEFFNIIDSPLIIRVSGRTAKNKALTPPRLRMISKK